MNNGVVRDHLGIFGNHLSAADTVFILHVLNNAHRGKESLLRRQGDSQ
jgi:hypothetical protein